MFFALLITGSPTLLVEVYANSLPELALFMKDFLDKTSCSEVHEAEIKTSYFWSTLKPIVKITYFHLDSHLANPVVDQYPDLRTLYITSMQAGLFSLGNMCLKDNFQDILDKEGLTDFVVCLPWLCPVQLRPKVQDLLWKLQSTVASSAPKLGNLVKAKLAATILSLDTVLEVDFVHHLHTRHS